MKRDAIMRAINAGCGLLAAAGFVGSAAGFSSRGDVPATVAAGAGLLWLWNWWCAERRCTRLQAQVDEALDLGDGLAKRNAEYRAALAKFALDPRWVDWAKATGR